MPDASQNRSPSSITVDRIIVDRIIEASPGTNAPLENLPAEIRLLLLHSLELEQLRSLVRASPVFHQQYLLNRRSVLCSSLEQTLGTATLDACAAHRAGMVGALAENSPERPDALDRFRATNEARRQPSKPYPISAEGLTEDQLASMAAFYLSIIKPLTQAYAAWALSNLDNQTSTEHQHAPLSRTEETRITRALYRFELSCYLYGHAGNIAWRTSLSLREALPVEKLTDAFEPWEMEELVCVYEFVKDRYDLLFKAIHWDVHPDNPRFDDQGRPPTPEGAFEFDSDYTRETLLLGTMSHGLALLHSLLTNPHGHDHLVRTMQSKITYAGMFSDLSHEWSDTGQSSRRQYWPCERDLKQRRRDPLPFRDDGPPDDEGDRPPLAWTIIWQGTYSYLYGEFIPDVMHRWGYVMWDAARIEGTQGVGDMLRWQWEAEWGYGEDDPRAGLVMETYEVEDLAALIAGTWTGLM